MVLPSRVTGLAMRAERKVIDETIDGLTFHSGNARGKLGQAQA
jgi:hypothetical protein